MRATFGRLADRELVLRPGMNLIHGDNETGKSTWVAFLLAMLYGIDTRDRVRAGRLPDKVQYQPWSGKPMTGLLELTEEGRSLRLERTSQTAPMGELRVWDRDTGNEAEDLTSKNCGQALLGVEAEVFLRSACLRQRGISVSADPRLEKRLNSLVTAGDEDYACGDLDEKLKKLQTALRHNHTGAIPRAEDRRRELLAQLDEIAQKQQSLAGLEGELQALRRRRDQCRETLAGIEALERQKALEQARSALSASSQKREALEKVCAALPDQALTSELREESRQLREALQDAALEEAAAARELPPPDPIFVRMDAQQVGEQAAADAAAVHAAACAEQPEDKYSIPCLVLFLAGLTVGIIGALLYLPLPAIGGSTLSLAGLTLFLWLRSRLQRAENQYDEFQRQAREILSKYGAENPEQILQRGRECVEALNCRAQAETLHRERLSALAQRREALMARLEAVFPGCRTQDQADTRFREAAEARQALDRARVAETACADQLKALEADAEDVEIDGDLYRWAVCSRQTTLEHLNAAAREIAARAQEAAVITGAIGQMGDPLALNGELEALERDLAAMEARYAALALARETLAKADETLRARFAPLLCKRTGAIFERLTAGAYDEVRLDRSLQVTVHPKNSTVFRPLSCLSGGTVDQLYLALRLAISELLVPKAPLILDDALICFDDHRAALAMETLMELSKTRQILFFTCQGREKRILDSLLQARNAQASVQPESEA